MNPSNQNSYPYTINTLCKEQWTRKAANTLMMSFQSQQQTLPILKEIQSLLQRLKFKELSQTFEGSEVQEFFFTNIFPVVCQKLINSKYFRNDQVLHLSNSIMQLCIEIYNKYIHLSQIYPKWAQLLVIIFDPDAQYFRSNDQLDTKSYPWQYYSTVSNQKIAEQKLKIGQYIDAIKLENSIKKATWSRGIIINKHSNYIQVQFLNDIRSYSRQFSVDSVEIAEYKTKSLDFQWRLALKQGDIIDCCDTYGIWYVATILAVKQVKNGGKTIKVGFRVYDPSGQKQDSQGKYIGLSQYYDEDNIDVTNPKIQKPQTIAKYKQYSINKHQSDYINDSNDNQFEFVNGQQITFVPRTKYLSGFLFKVVRNFIKIGGYDKMFNKLQQKLNIDILVPLVSSLGNIATNLHKSYIKKLISKLQPIIHKHLYDESEASLKTFTKQKSQFIFNGMKYLIKRIKSLQQYKQYENKEKLGLALMCLNNDTLKRRLQGIGELKDILRTYRIHLNNRLEDLSNWLKVHKIFEKVYVNNSHVQLIKRSTDFFRFLINQNILELDELSLIYRAAQKGDYETKISIYKLFQEVSHNFKKNHVDFLIDQILESELSLISSEDIDLLHQLSRYSNYFPLHKVMTYFQKIIFSQTNNLQLLQASIKKYTDIVNKNYDMKNHRKDVILKFLEKITTTNNIEVIIKVLTNIFQNVTSGGQWGKYELLQVLQDNSFDQIILKTLRRIKTDTQITTYIVVAEKLLNFLNFIVGISTRVRISMETFIQFWNELIKNSICQEEKQIYYRWCNEVCKGDHLSQSKLQKSKFQDFFLKLTNQQEIANLNEKGFQIIKHLFLDINKKQYKITMSSVWKSNKEVKLYKVKTWIENLKFYNNLLELIYKVSDFHIALQALQLFNMLYASQQIKTENRLQYFNKNLDDFFIFANQKAFEKVIRNLKILEFIIDQSEKDGSGTLKSLVTIRKGEQLTLQILNETSCLPDNLKKMEIKISSNSTLLQLRKKIGLQLGIHWQQLRINQKEQLSQLLNSKIIKDLKIKLNESLIINKKSTYLIPEESLIISNKLNPKAQKALRSVFKRYSTNGRMNRQQCAQFIGLCLGDLNKFYEQKLENLFKKYDKQKKQYIVAENIIDFYQQSAKEKPTTVWNNLRNCGIRNDFKCYDDEDDIINTQLLPRYHLSTNNNFYQSLFSLLDQDDRVAKATWLLLQRLPISHNLYNQVIKLKDEKKEKQEWKMLDLNSPYKTIYTLYVFEYLTDNDEQNLLQNEKVWKKNFIQAGGYEYLFELFKKIIIKEKLKSIQKNIVEFILKMIKKYLINCFANETMSKSYAILQSTLQFQQITQYLKNYEYPTDLKDQNKMKQYVKLITLDEIKKYYNWNGQQKSHIIDHILTFIKKLWNEAKNEIQRDSQLENCFEILLVLLFDDCSSLIQILPNLLEKQISINISQRLYKLLIGLCYSEKNRNIIINFLITLLNSKRISKQYFKALALLVFKYGLTKQNQNIPLKLIESILSNQNQLVIEGCAYLLMQIEVNYEQFDINIIKQLWTKCLFSRNITCKSENSREVIYNLLIKFAKNRTQFASILTTLTIQTLNGAITKSKIMSPNDVLNRSIYNYAGIKNIGNICYMLAMIQQFYTNPTFRNLILRIDDHQAPLIKIHNNRQIDDNLLHQFRKMFAYLNKTERMDFVPTDFCYSFKDFSGQPINVTIQQDAQQFISMIFDKLENAIKGTPFKHILDNIYGGKVSNLFTCQQCNQVKIRQQNFYSLSVQVKNSKNLAESFNKLILGQVINDFKCDFCNKKADVVKKTAISKPPNTLIIHLQRLVFNFDTFLNEKINSKLDFPMQLNLQPYTLSALQNVQNSQNYEYTLKGVVAHYGTAQFGHYYSFIKTNQNQWLEFNDSKVYQFDVKNIETQCFGGQNDNNMMIIQDQFELGKKQNSKNAYILIYQKTKKGKIELEFNSEEQKNQCLNKLNLFQLPKQIQKKKSVAEDEQELQFQPTQIFRKLSREYKDVEVEKPSLNPTEQNSNLQQSEEIIYTIPQNDEKKQEIKPVIKIELSEIIPDYFPEIYRQQIQQDNLLHQFEVNICSPSFLKYYNDLLKVQIPNELCPQFINLTEKLVFGIWLKNPFLKQILSSFQYTLKRNSSASLAILKNQAIFTMLLQSSDVEMRTSISILLVKCVNSIIQTNKLTLTRDSELDTIMVDYLDNLFSQLPTTVAKNWMKFSQYFQFWKNFAQQGEVQFNYLMRKETITHFIDYFLEKKSPLQIYSNKKYAFGNRYTEPNFVNLFATVSYLINEILKNHPQKMSKKDKLMLLDYNFLDKLITQNNQIFVNKIILSTATNSLYSSSKIAIVILKGLNKTTYQNVQPFLQVINTFLRIQDKYQQYRVRWVLGHPTLVVSTISKTLTAFNSYTTQQRLYIYDSPIQFDMSVSLLEPLYKTNHRAQNFCCMCLKALLILCNEVDYIFDYVYNLPPPCLNQAKYYDFVKDYLDLYIDEARRYNYGGFPREQLGKMTQQLFHKFLEKVSQKQKKIREFQNVIKKEEVKESPQIQNNQQFVEIPLEKQQQYKQQQQKQQFKNANHQGIEKPSEEDMQIIKLLLDEEQKNNEVNGISDSEMIQQLEFLKQYEAQKANEADSSKKSKNGNTNPAQQLLNVEQGEENAVPWQPAQSPNKDISEDNSPIKNQFKIFPQNSVSPITKDIQQGNNNPNPNENQPIININAVQDALHDDTMQNEEQVKIEIVEQLVQEVPELIETPKVWHPCIFKYNQTSSQTNKGLILNYHESELTLILTRPEGKKNSTFPGIFQKLSMRIPEELMKNAQIQIVKGYFITNTSRDYIRLKWKFGTACIKASESMFIWADKIDKIWITDREMDWPKWSLYDQDE